MVCISQNFQYHVVGYGYYSLYYCILLARNVVAYYIRSIAMQCNAFKRKMYSENTKRMVDVSGRCPNKIAVSIYN